MEAVNLAIFTGLAVLAWLGWRPESGWYWVLRARFARSDRILREDALKYFTHCELESEPATLRGAAGSLGVNGGETSRVITQLAEQGLLAIDGAEFRLTPEGRAYGLRIIRAHRLYETYMSEKTGFAGDEWHERAERAEHALSEDDIRALDQALAFPVHDPHGDPIPTADGEFRLPEGMIDLVGLPDGERAVVAHLEDEPAALFREISAAGLYPGQKLRMIATGHKGVRVRAEGREHQLSHLAAANVHVVPCEQDQAAGRSVPRESLASIPTGAPFRIRSISPRISGSERRRLMDLGFLPDTKVVKEFTSAAGDPISFLVRGTLIALRREQAACILVGADQSAPAPSPTAGATS